MWNLETPNRWTENQTKYSNQKQFVMKSLETQQAFNKTKRDIEKMTDLNENLQVIENDRNAFDTERNVHAFKR